MKRRKEKERLKIITRRQGKRERKKERVREREKEFGKVSTACKDCK